MIAATIFTVLSVSATAVFIQNQRASVGLRYRTQVTNTALNILEQLRLKNYNDLKILRDTALAAPNTLYTTLVLVADPLYTIPTSSPYTSLNLPVGLRPLELNLNAVDGTVISMDRTNFDIPMEVAINATKLPTRYWLTLKVNESMSTPRVEVIEVALIYQWRMPNQTTWQEGTIRLAVTKPQAIKNSPATITP
jgi:hypothetical protein